MRIKEVVVGMNQARRVKRLKMIDLIGAQYKAIMESRKRYLVVKGSRASKKSKNIAIRWILLLYEFEKANLLVVRKYSSLLKQSCRADLIWAIKRIGVEADWSIPKAELTLTRKSTGQVILFRGVSEPASIASITVEQGVLNFAWIEEAYQLDKEQDFDMIDEAIRGQLPEGYFKQIVLTFNPWHESSWLRTRFYIRQPEEVLDDEVRYVPNKQKSSEHVLALTRNYDCNEWLDAADLANFERMRVEQPERYKVAGLGEWGVTGSRIYENYEVREFDWKKLFYEKDRFTDKPKYEHRIGLDFGYSAHTAGVRLLVDREAREIYVCEELYEQRLSTDEIGFKLKELDWHREPIHADSEDPRTIRELKKTVAPRIFGVKKERGSVMSGIQQLRGYRIIINPKCYNFELEISHYAFKKNAAGKELPAPEKGWDHLMDAMRYAMVDDTAGVEFVDLEQGKIASANESREAYEERLKQLIAQRR